LSWLKTTFTTALGKKVLVALSGLSLVLFIITHLIGNMMVFATAYDDKGVRIDDSGLNAYAKALHDLPGFTVVEFSLLALFIIHIVLVLNLVMQNRAARGSARYAVTASKRGDGRWQSLASRSMVVGGILLLLFLLVHIWDIRLQRDAIPDLHGHLAELFQSPFRVVLYVLGSLLVAWHVLHGFQSAFRSLGFNHGKYSPFVRKGGALLCIIIGLGFAAIPIWFFIGQG